MELNNHQKGKLLKANLLTIKEQYKAGVSARELALTFGVGKSVIHKLLKKAGVPMRNKPWRKADEKAILSVRVAAMEAVRAHALTHDLLLTDAASALILAGFNVLNPSNIHPSKATSDSPFSFNYPSKEEYDLQNQIANHINRPSREKKYSGGEST